MQRFFPISAVVLLLVCGLSMADGDEGAWWVFFADRGPEVEARLAARTEELANSPSIDRRIAAGLTGADLLDLEPWVGYTEQVLAVCGTAGLRTTSRLLNAVSVEADPSEVARILEIPAVASVRPVSASDFQQPVLQPLTTGTTDLTSFQLSQIALDQLHIRGWKGEGMVLGILDTGYELGHEAFNSTLILGAWDFIDDDSDPSWQEGDPPGQSDHGTAVLSIIGGSWDGGYSGGAPSAAFLVAKTEDISGEYQAEEDYWVAGLEWAEANGADLVSSSLGYIDWYTYEDMDGNTAVTTLAADAAASRGMPVFNSIGNRGPGAGTMNAPADGDSVFSVGAVDGAGYIAGFSSRGPTFDGRIKPDACALGVGVVLAQATGGFSSGNGTSFSTPLCAAAAAAVAGAHGEWTIFDVMDALKITSSMSDSPDNDFGWGLIDALSAVRYRSVTGVVRTSLDGLPLADYPLGIGIGDSLFLTETNAEGWFAICPGFLGGFEVMDVGGPGSVITVTGDLFEEGVEIQVFVDCGPLVPDATVFPNPSEGGIYVGFDVIEGPADVELSVHSLTGELVYGLSRTGLASGSYRAPLPGEAMFWPGTDDTGQPVASGVYILVLDDGNGIQLLKAAVVR